MKVRQRILYLRKHGPQDRVPHFGQICHDVQTSIADTLGEPRAQDALRGWPNIDWQDEAGKLTVSTWESVRDPDLQLLDLELKLRGGERTWTVSVLVGAQQPGEIVVQEVCRLTPDESFAAAVLAVYAAETRELTYLNCGHNPAPLWLPADADKPICLLDDAGAMILGVIDDVPCLSATVTLHAGDKVAFFTDGVTEAVNAEDAMFGLERLMEHLRTHQGAAPGELIDSLVHRLAEFTTGRGQHDDRTMLAFRTA